jgi:hypothetical protein
MKIPAFLFGTLERVKPRSRAFLRSVVAGKPEIGPLLDTVEVEGLLVLDRLSRAMGAQSHFQLYAPMAVASQLPRTDAALIALFGELVKSPWGCLALMGQEVQHVPRMEEQRTAFLRTVLASWGTYVAEGRRYTFGSQMTQTLWDLPTLIQHELARRGLSATELNQPLPGGDLRALLQRHGTLFADILESVS